MTMNQSDTSALITECAHPDFTDMDTLTTLERIRLMNSEDKKVAGAVERELANIASAVSLVVASFKSGGRLIYIGAGTSGRLGVLDASECPPTFSTEPHMVTAFIAGGPSAVFTSVEGAEDSAQEGRLALQNANVMSNDTVIGISASGRAPYVIGAIEQAITLGASTVAVTNNRPSQIERLAGVTIAPIVGPEVLAGSTRMKAGTAQKMVLNLITTNAMIEIGKTYGNRMIDVRASNVKLRDRALRMTMDVTGASTDVAMLALSNTNGSVKLAILMIERGLSAVAAAGLLAANDGFLRRALSA